MEDVDRFLSLLRAGEGVDEQARKILLRYRAKAASDKRDSETSRKLPVRLSPAPITAARSEAELERPLFMSLPADVSSPTRAQ